MLVVESQGPGTEPIERPKDFVMGWIKSWAQAAATAGPSNRITLLRDADGDGAPEIRRPCSSTT